MEKFQQLSDTSKVWVYTASRELDANEIDFARKEIDLFTQNWAAHGSALTALGDVIENRFVVLAVDEAAANASGCSIDTSVQFMKALGNELNIDFFNRMFFYTPEKEKVHFSDLAESGKDVYNVLAKNLGELRHQWLVSAEEILAL